MHEIEKNAVDDEQDIDNNEEVVRVPEGVEAREAVEGLAIRGVPSDGRSTLPVKELPWACGEGDRACRGDGDRAPRCSKVCRGGIK